MYRSGSPAWFSTLMASRSQDQRCHGRGAVTARVQIDAGAVAGVQSKSAVGYPSIFRTMPLCGYLTKPFTKRCTFRGVGLYDESCQLAYALAEHYGFHAPDLNNEASHSLPLT
jgi:hypothetical protein